MGNPGAPLFGSQREIQDVASLGGRHPRPVSLQASRVDADGSSVPTEIRVFVNSKKSDNQHRPQLCERRRYSLGRFQKRGARESSWVPSSSFFQGLFPKSGGDRASSHCSHASRSLGRAEAPQGLGGRLCVSCRMIVAIKPDAIEAPTPHVSPALLCFLIRLTVQNSPSVLPGACSPLAPPSP